MGSSTKVYFDQNKDNRTMPMAFVLDAIRVSVNELVQASYDKYNVNSKEINPSIPLIRNAGTIDSFECTAHSYTPEIEPFMSFRTYPILFVAQNEVGGFPQHSFKHVKEGAEVYHQARTLWLMENNNIDLANHIDNVSDKNRFFSISFADDTVGQEFMFELAKKLKAKLDTTVYYQRSDVSDKNKVVEVN